MLNKKMILLTILLVSLLTISAVSATEDATSDIANTNDDLIIEESISEQNPNPNQEQINENINEQNPNPNQEQSIENINEPNIEDINEELSTEAMCFKDFNYSIHHSGRTFNLDNNVFCYYADSDSGFGYGVPIDHAVTIYGNNYMIDGDDYARGFIVTHSDVTIYDVYFCHLVSDPDDDSGAAVDGECTLINCTFHKCNTCYGGATNKVTAINCTFIDNYAYQGGAIFEGKAINCTFINNHAVEGGAAYGTELINCTFINNTVTGMGGAVFQANVTDSKFENNKAEDGDGGAIAFTNATNCIFINNHAEYGGAMAAGTATNCTFNKNDASKNGGAIYIATAINCTIHDNEATLEGGAIYDGIAINCTISNNIGLNGGATYNSTTENCKFIGNKAQIGGANCYGEAIDCTFNNNEATENGGAIYQGNATNCIFTQNKAMNGGAIYEGNATNSNFTENNANQGGAIYNSTARYCYFNHNYAMISGGAMKEGTAINCTFTFNRGANGGAISKGIAINSNFLRNTADSGGAIFESEATHCNFYNNNAMHGGAACYCDVANSYFKQNTANKGGAVYEGNATLSTFIQNSASEKGGAVYGTPVTYCNFTENSAENGGAIYQGNATNCIFTQNNASDSGGAMNEGNATNCIFTQNNAELGEAIYNGTAILCIFENNGNDETDIVSAYLTANDFTSTYDSGEKLLFNLTANGMNYDGYKTTIYVYENEELIGTYYALSGEAGGWVVNLTPGTYKANISLDRYSGVHNCVSNIKISSNTTLIANDLITIYNSADEFVITLSYGEGKPVSGVNVTVDLNGKKNYTTDKDGQIRISTKGIPANTYNVNITFDGDEDFLESNTTALVIINKETPIILINVNNIIHGDKAVINFTLTDSHYNNITDTLNVTVGEESYNINVIDGQGSITIENLEVDTYKVVANYEGNQNYNPANNNAKFNVSKMTSKILYNDLETVAIDINLDGRIGEYFYITLVDGYGNPIANKLVQIGFNGNVYNRTTDAKGQAKIQINIARENIYTFAISFLGDENYTGAFEAAKISVQKQTPQLAVPNKSYKATAKTKTLTASFKTAKGNALAGKKITFTVNGKTYSAKTNAKGVASVKVSLNKKGTYKFTSKFAGDSTYKAISKTATLKLT